MRKENTYYSKNREKLLEYQRVRRSKAGYREKQAQYYREWYKRHGRKRNGKYSSIIKLWRKKNKKRVDAIYEVNLAIKGGRLKRPYKCSVCGREGRVQGHHEDYDRMLDVIWVCASCHKRIHKGV